jgi:DNA-binding CsgD family transcriptional regulator
MPEDPDRIERLESALRRAECSPRQIECYVLRVTAPELTLAQIGVLLDIQPQAVHVHLGRAKRRINAAAEQFRESDLWHLVKQDIPEVNCVGEEYWRRPELGHRGKVHAAPEHLRGRLTPGQMDVLRHLASQPEGVWVALSRGQAGCAARMEPRGYVVRVRCGRSWHWAAAPDGRKLTENLRVPS